MIGNKTLKMTLIMSKLLKSLSKKTIVVRILNAVVFSNIVNRWNISYTVSQTMSRPDIRTKRVPVELTRLKASYNSHYIECDPVIDNDFTKLQAVIPGPKDSPFEHGNFKVSIEFTAQYPFQPPVIKFLTPVYHPNIDNVGKICLDVLRMPPNGSYNPALTLESILLSIQMLLGSPNPDDPLQSSIADVYKHDREKFNVNAKSFTRKYASADYEPGSKKPKKQ